MGLLKEETEKKLKAEVILNLDQDLRDRKELIDRLTSLLIARVWDSKRGIIE